MYVEIYKVSCLHLQGFYRQPKSLTAVFKNGDSGLGRLQLAPNILLLPGRYYSIGKEELHPFLILNTFIYAAYAGSTLGDFGVGQEVGGEAEFSDLPLFIISAFSIYCSH